MTSFNHYVVAKKIARDLKKLGYVDWYNKVDDAIVSGSTGTEILMALRWHFKELIKSNATLPQELSDRINELNEKINESLS